MKQSATFILACLLVGSAGSSSGSVIRLSMVDEISSTPAASPAPPRQPVESPTPHRDEVSQRQSASMPARAAFVDPVLIESLLLREDLGHVETVAEPNGMAVPTGWPASGRLRFQYCGLAVSRLDSYGFWSPWATCTIRRMFDDAVLWTAGFRYGGADGVMYLASRGQVCSSSEPYAANFEAFFGDYASRMGLVASLPDEFPSINLMLLDQQEGMFMRPMLERAEDQR